MEITSLFSIKSKMKRLSKGSLFLIKPKSIDKHNCIFGESQYDCTSNSLILFISKLALSQNYSGLFKYI